MKPVALVLAFLIPAALSAVERGQSPDLRNITAHRDLAYVTDGHPRQVLDLFVPTGHDSPLPVIVWIHGGAWRNGSKNGCPPMRQGFVDHGYAVASIEYRLSHDAVFPAQIEDCKAAIRWLRAHAVEYGLDADHIGVWGSSAGGHLVALLGTAGESRSLDVGENPDTASAVQAVCDFYGPTDFLQMDANRPPGAALAHDPATSPESLLVGGPIQDPRFLDNVRLANPITHLASASKVPPFLIVHGDSDGTVPHHQSELLHAALVSKGAMARFVTVRGGGHGAGFPHQILTPMVLAFFDHHLRGLDTEAAAWPQTSKATVDAVR